MKRAVPSILIVLIFLVLASASGCSPAPADVNESEEDAGEMSDVSGSPDEAAEAGGTDADQVIEQAIQEEAEIQETEEELSGNMTADANATQEYSISGSLELQTDLERCPHLAQSFSCDRYDIRRCEFKRFTGRNGFYPDLIDCRDGRAEKGQDPEKKYCLIQECSPLTEENIVQAYGGPTAYAEYDYRVEKIEGGIMTHYSLLRCGETYKQFDNEFDCTVYKSRLDMFK